MAEALNKKYIWIDEIEWLYIITYSYDFFVILYIYASVLNNYG